MECIDEVVSFVTFFTLLVFYNAHNFALASFINLGAASDYNVFIKNDFSASSSDVEGRVAAGGNVTLSNYSVNIKNSKQLYGDTTELPALVVGRDFDFYSGNIAGDAFVGGNYYENTTGTITNGKVRKGNSPIDFEAEFSDLKDLSKTLSELDSTGNSYDR